MRAKWIGVGVLITLVVVLIIISVGWLFWRRSPWAYGMHGGWMGSGMMGNTWNTNSCPVYPGQTSPYSGGRMGWGMMGNGYPADGCYLQDGAAYNDQDLLDMNMAEKAVLAYIDRYDEHLTISEIMEFERNFYAIVIEEDTGIGAMELLIDKSTGAVGPEMGPNMMWNTEYGMHSRGGMMSATPDDPIYDEHDMLDIAQDWLDDRKPGIKVAEHGDMFYGYMTVHTLENDEITGMLSVNASTGDVWYHTWHGDFIAMETFTHADTHD